MSYAANVEAVPFALKTAVIGIQETEGDTEAKKNS